MLFDGTAEFYRKWKARADADPAWGEGNPIHIEVTADRDQGIRVRYLPEIV